MGRYVYFETGNFKWEGKFSFGVQCSNFGSLLEELKKSDYEVYVNRYIADDGEYVRLNTNRSHFLKALKNLLGSIDRCPVCNSSDCLTATKEMLVDLIEQVEKEAPDYINALWFVEY